RVGFAANVHPGTVIRGGYARVFFRDNTGPQVPFADPPYVFTYAPNPSTTTLSTPLPIPAPQSVTNLSGAIRGMQLDYKNSHVDEASFNVEQSFGATVLTAGYVGVFGRNLRISPDLDFAPPSPVSYITRRPFYSVLPNVTSTPHIESSGYSNYNAMQVSLQRRLNGGLTANANYTWSHIISDTQGYSQGGLYTSALPYQTATLERGNGDLDIRQRFALMLNYQIPFGASLTGWRGGLIKGWQVNAIDVWQTGFPFTVVNGSPQSDTGIGSDRPNVVGNPIVSNPSIHRWFNASAFTPQPFGTIGNEARDALYGPHFRHFDLSLFKIFALTERLHLETRAESFNLTNTPNFALPNATLGTTSTGTISSTRTGSTPRQLQFAMRLTF
ncbi:MAG: hypothetical protein JOZ62_12045, partial [Acidobacteriaceae bacterium]|nr:hypothetical protein [Acidobacteriaceae bacterium]